MRSQILLILLIATTTRADDWGLAKGDMLREDIKAYTEPRYAAISVDKNPNDHSDDNGPLFSATYYLELASLTTPNNIDRNWFTMISYVYGGQDSGTLVRYPNTDSYTSHDDLAGMAIADYLASSGILSQYIYAYGEEHNWVWPQNNWLGRMPYFKATIKACARKKLTLWDQILFSGALVGNFFEDKSQTSGRCLLYLSSRAVYGHGLLSNIAIHLWRAFMQKTYPDGMREVYSIYFGPTHPISRYARKDFL